MKIFYRPIVDRIRDDVFVLDRYDLFMIKTAGILFYAAVAVLVVAAILAYYFFDRENKKGGWISVAIGLVSLFGMWFFPTSRGQYILDIANKNSLTAEEFQTIQQKLTEEADLRVPLPGQKRKK